MNCRVAQARPITAATLSRVRDVPNLTSLPLANCACTRAAEHQKNYEFSSTWACARATCETRERGFSFSFSALETRVDEERDIYPLAVEANLTTKESERTRRSIKGDRLQLADPANFIHGELSRVDRQWTPNSVLLFERGERKI